MCPKMRSILLAAALFCFCVQTTAAERYAIHRRDEPTISSSSDAVAETSTSAAKPTDGSESTAAQPSSTSISSRSTTSSVSSTIISVSKSATGSSAVATATLDSSIVYNSTIPTGQLPIEPRITIGFGVAGIILILTGIGYALVGIKSKLVHISLSAAYLASVSVTVLIIYVMNPPISNAVQGAYVVAVVLTGAFVGGGACIFTELTEGLGALLGGFCFSMWLLCLKPGGLLTTQSAKIGFIAAFSAAAFATTFTHYSRPYGLIGGISFAGATAVVLGIDCFSRAGLKEFWAYVWDLNDNLFPLGATTYPVTRGIRVETAAIFVLFLVGIVSQSKLWKIVKERRQKRALEKEEGDMALRQEEEDIGRRIEQQAAMDRDMWEKIHGKPMPTSDDLSRTDSGVGGMNKRGISSAVTSEQNLEEVKFEMDAMPAVPKVDNTIVVAAMEQDGALHAPEPASPETLDHGAEKSITVEHASNDQQAVVVPKSDIPVVVPLPFKVPDGMTEVSQSDRSSVATFADDEATRHNRLSKQFPPNSIMPRRSSHESKRNSNAISQSIYSVDTGSPTVEDDRRSSIAATMDELSEDEGMYSRASTAKSPVKASFQDITTRPSTESARVQGRSSKERSTRATTVIGESEAELESEQKNTEAIGVPTRPYSMANSAFTVATDILNPATPLPSTPTIQWPATSSIGTVSEPSPLKNEDFQNRSEEQTQKNDNVSLASAISKPTSITKDRLPRQSSRVVISYRTNEWAKHLSNAEAPTLEELKLAESPSEQDAHPTEVAAPVNVEELQQTPENAQPAPAPRIVVQTADRESKISPAATPSDGSLTRKSSQDSVKAKHGAHRSSSTPIIDRTIVESPIEGYFSVSNGNHSPPTAAVPFNSPHTLMGQRNTMIRNRSSYSIIPPAQHSGSSSDTSSIYTTLAALPVAEADNMTLAARRSLIRQSSLQDSMHKSAFRQSSNGFDSHQPQRQSTLKDPRARDMQMAQWRASVQQDLVSGSGPVKSSEGERQRNQLLQDRQIDAQRKLEQVRRKEKRDSRFDEKMRRGGDMLEAHREALRKMQRVANKGLEE
ncbi:hypothetical protein PVAG01_09653 [Phlyctema vagabunda]|uniref:TM7S3/TM198-like domain-containing protein n=1 Tax=Phlyctema vagabunda TaxID=108571 RepID=A0ABR4P7X9_9HELO